MKQYLTDVDSNLERALARGDDKPALFEASQIQRTTVQVKMRDGIQLATDLYLPPKTPGPAIAIRTPYGRDNERNANACRYFAQRGYVVIAQDCRGTGGSEPGFWDYYVYESEDGVDLVEWVAQQPWFNGFLASCGGSYVGQTQWGMALHPRMSTLAPEVSGLGVAVNTAHLYMFLNAYARSVGKGEDKVGIPYNELEKMMLEETLAGGYFNEPLHLKFPEPLLARYPELKDLPPSKAKRRLWEQYCALPSAERSAFIKQASGSDRLSIVEVESLPSVFGHAISHDAHTIPDTDPAALSRRFRAPPLLITGWYDWGLNDALATWELIRREAEASVRANSRLIITPGAHNKPGYHEGDDQHPELKRIYRLDSTASLLVSWYAAVQANKVESWPRVIYYLMGENKWRVADDWPPPEAKQTALYLGKDGILAEQKPQHDSAFDRYVYDPKDPTPTMGGSIVSAVYPAGSVDVSELQKRSDVLTYTTEPLTHDLDVVGPLRMVLYASSSAVDTDFCARLSDVFPDGRAIQLQNGILRARYRNAEPELLEPGRVYRFEIDMWATANRFKKGHRLRVDISSADFPKYDRNANLGGQLGEPVAATQQVYFDSQHPSHLVLSVLGG